MASTRPKIDVAVDYVHDAYVAAEHVLRLVENAREALKHGNVAEADRALVLATDPAEMVRFRVQWALKAVGECEVTR